MSPHNMKNLCLPGRRFFCFSHECYPEAHWVYGRLNSSELV